VTSVIKWLDDLLPTSTAVIGATSAEKLGHLPKPLVKRFERLHLSALLMIQCSRLGKVAHPTIEQRCLLLQYSNAQSYNWVSVLFVNQLAGSKYALLRKRPDA
jgi:hypothetical protein